MAIFVHPFVPKTIIRHRFDGLVQHFNGKKNLGDDPEVRLEVNLLLDLAKGDQREAVRKFLDASGFVEIGFLSLKTSMFMNSQMPRLFFLSRPRPRQCGLLYRSRINPPCKC
jgi:hypothetical protein